MLSKLYKEYRLAKKWFQKPEWHIAFYKKKGNLFDFIEVKSYPLSWKWKCDYDQYVSFERFPEIVVILFGRFVFKFTLNCPKTDGEYDDNIYWETMLDYLYRFTEGTEEERLWRAYSNNIWRSVGDDGREVFYTVLPYLTFDGIKAIYKVNCKHM